MLKSTLDLHFMDTKVSSLRKNQYLCAMKARMIKRGTYANGLDLHREELMENWELAQKGAVLRKIEPLK